MEGGALYWLVMIVLNGYIQRDSRLYRIFFAGTILERISLISYVSSVFSLVHCFICKGLFKSENALVSYSVPVWGALHSSTTDGLGYFDLVGGIISISGFFCLILGSIIYHIIDRDNTGSHCR
jgi:hypothetical protein